jgi:membrane associated rhomboid family serine protease
VALDGPDPRWQVGTLDAVGDSTLLLRTSRGARLIPARDVHRLEASLGRAPSVPGGIAGLVLGGAVGGALGCLANRDDYGVFCGGQRDAKVVVGAVLGGAVGAAVGAVALRRERWRPVEWGSPGPR